MYPRFAVSRHFATSSSSFTCSSNVREITNRSSKYTNTTRYSEAGLRTSVTRLLHGLSLSSITPRRNISSTSANNSSCTAGDTGPTICGANPNFRQKSTPRYSACFNDGHKNNSIGCFWPLYAITTVTWPRI
ncbi:uncharacterized protein LOC117591759 [Drosophila guanche]|uniref:uncharacterized protein LOC117591759 n=1 Tax=Drosophila guanche TaxID=7266 RepID=UPI001472234C|nr:uncharacterized protein LOC117591759 [Drosophila guanche]XP_034140958.1 uncharacterized protein LOC117591759 [Drosophila guanche]XP_034140959.1 uncharacterized protein LOC117591759 [Drosophila guanche]XP_034140960.1 uncharacterized protein LOC117591759 [Drosophila guanche]XP_034140961.1 uncharacterized protein LOC117591759 [Drosophila guanche]XP_034140962.1 uncharacterized protein LOC117591759 [Drosophila guanche]